MSQKLEGEVGLLARLDGSGELDGLVIVKGGLQPAAEHRVPGEGSPHLHLDRLAGVVANPLGV